MAVIRFTAQYVPSGVGTLQQQIADATLKKLVPRDVPPYTGPRWLLVQTNAGQEAYAEHSLTGRMRDFTVFFPKVLQQRCHARKVEFVARPFLPRYGFVLDDGRSVSLIRSAPGVNRVVTIGDPVLVRQDVIDDIKRREYGRINVNTGKVEHFVKLDDEPQPECIVFKRGENVTIVDRDDTVVTAAVFKHALGSHRVVVFFGSLGNMIVPIGQVRKIV